jgi:hypothetical protein
MWHVYMRPSGRGYYCMRLFIGPKRMNSSPYRDAHAIPNLSYLRNVRDEIDEIPTFIASLFSLLARLQSRRG